MRRSARVAAVSCAYSCWMLPINRPGIALAAGRNPYIPWRSTGGNEHRASARDAERLECETSTLGSSATMSSGEELPRDLDRRLARVARRLRILVGLDRGARLAALLGPAGLAFVVPRAFEPAGLLS